MRNVEVGTSFSGFQVIQKGVSAGEHVVTEGLQKVHDGLLVTPHLVASTPPQENSPGVGSESPPTVSSPGRS